VRLLEHQAKHLLEKFGLIFSRALLAASADEAGRAAESIGGAVVLKAQVPFGGRGKLGAVLTAATPADARDASARLLAMELRGYPVRSVSVEGKIAFQREYYAGIAWDAGEKLPVAILSTAGGIDIEQAADKQVARATFDPFTGLRAFRGRELARQLELGGRAMINAGAVLEKLSHAFLQLDGVTIEINPLIETPEGALIGLDAHVEIDDDALGRVKPWLEPLGPIESVSAGRPPTELEKEAQRIDAMDHRGVAGRVVEFDGDLALLIGGGGASLTVFDAIRRYGGKPANYCEVGGNPTVEKVAALVELLLGRRGVKKLAVIMNVVNNTRADVMARGTIEGIQRAGRSARQTISVFRIPGSWETEAREILAGAGIEGLGREVSLDAAAKLAVQRSHGAAES
jgi:succinyl-CoA synthetase beta subunit/citryl-CoA synthetase large subunit